MNNEKQTKEGNNIADFIGWALFGNGIISFINYLRLSFVDDTTDKWFSRLFLSLMCFGIAGIIFRLRK